MAIIIQQKLFSWKDVDLSGELERLKTVMVVMLTMALARIKMNQAEDMRSLIKQAA